jgi:hypothetical protein
MVQVLLMQACSFYLFCFSAMGSFTEGLIKQYLKCWKFKNGEMRMFMAKAKDKTDPFRLMGSDIEFTKTLLMKLLKKAADEVLETLGLMIQFLQLLKLEALALRR